jgi:hypothetical protein
MISHSPWTWTLSHERQAERRREADKANLARIATTMTRPADRTARRQLRVPIPGLAR